MKHRDVIKNTQGDSYVIRGKSSSINSTHYAKLYPQNGERIVTLDSVTSIHPFRSVSMPAGFRRHLVGKSLRNVCYSVVTSMHFVSRLMIIWTFS